MHGKRYCCGAVAVCEWVRIVHIENASGGSGRLRYVRMFLPACVRVCDRYLNVI